MFRIHKILLLILAIGTMACGNEKSQVGGFESQRRIKSEEKALFEQTTAHITDVEYKPMNVATQIVAGTNYRYLCKARRIDNEGKRGKRFYAAIVIHKPLPGQGEPKIISIERNER